MAETDPVESGFISEAVSFTLHHPIKALGNTVIFAYGVHVVREFKGPLADYISRQLESRRRTDDENKSVEYTTEQ